MPVVTNEVSWLDSGPSLEELRDRYPADWRKVESEVAILMSRGDMAEISAVVARSASAAPANRRSTETRRQNDAVAAEVRRRMTLEAIRRACNGLATGVEGSVRFNRVNGWAFQWLLFHRGLERKPVRISRFKIVWRLAWQRRILMTLVQPKGIYCFYSQELINGLVALVGDSTAVEIAAGDGTLTRFLSDAGVSVQASDDYSWSSSINYPDHVKRQDAKTALRGQQPEVVLCSWPPAGNKFEREVFAARSVQTYIVVTTRHEHAAGNWECYRRQKDFKMEEDAELSRLVLPPELDPVVLVFRRVRGGIIGQTPIHDA